MTALPLDINVVQRSQEVTAIETTSLIYWHRAMAESEDVHPGIHAFGQDCWSTGTNYEHAYSMYSGLQPDKTLWTTEQNNILAALLANFVAAQGKVDAIIGVASEETVRVNNDLAAQVTTLLASL